MVGKMFPGTIVPIILRSWIESHDRVGVLHQLVDGDDMKRITMLLAASCFLAGCGRTLTMTYYCVPSGASLLQNGQYLGQCPATFAYPVSEEARQIGVLTTQPIAARWPSGATATVSGVTAQLSSGMVQHFTFTRPSDAQGAELDYQVGADLDARTNAQQGEAGWNLGYLLGTALAK